MKRQVICLGLVLASATACNRNSSEKSDALSKATDAYCSCSKEPPKLPADEMAKTGLGGFCKAESQAFNSAIDALDVPFGKDPDAKKLHETYRACSRSLDDVHRAAMKAHGPK